MDRGGETVEDRLVENDQWQWKPKDKILKGGMYIQVHRRDDAHIKTKMRKKRAREEDEEECERAHAQ